MQLGVRRTMVTVPVRCSLKDNIARLPPITDVKAVYVEGLRKGTHSIPAVQGKMASVAIYAHLAAKYGKLTKEAAVEGLGLYAEMVEDAIARPGAHENIELLMAVRDAPEEQALSLVVEKKA